MSDGGRTRSRRTRGRVWRATLASLATLTSLVWAGPAEAFIFLSPVPSFPDTTGVGQTFPASVSVGNFSTPPESIQFPVLAIGQINLIPACASAGPPQDCAGAVESGVFQVAPTGVGSGSFSCNGTWTITEISPGTFRLTPPGGEGSLQLATGEVCTVNTSVTTRRVPTVDISPNPGVQTAQLACATAVNAPSPVRNCSTDQTTVFAATPSLSTVASQSSSQVPATTSDVATLSANAPPAVPPTGTITFNLYGPSDATCASAPVFSNTVPVNGTGNYPTSAPAPITSPGTYRWVASYSGDANYVPVTVACGDPNETVTVNRAQPNLVTVATYPVALGQPASDTASLSGGFNPTGTITFSLYGPNNPTCAGTPLFTSTVPVNGNGQYNSASFVPPGPGRYEWVAAYSGDANNFTVIAVCGAPNESTFVPPSTPTLTTTATPSVSLGQSISDTATITTPAGAPSSTGFVNFFLYGPNNPTCANEPVFVSTNRQVSGNMATSAPFTPPAAGTYRWVASYSGDSNYQTVSSACNDPNESSLVNSVAPTLVTQATPTVPLGQPITDTATVTGPPSAPAPTGTVAFTVYGPNNPTCAGPPIFVSSIRPLFGGPPSATATSDPFTPPAAGTYRWVAQYSGDPNFLPVTSTCNDVNETSVVTQVVASSTTNATPSASLGQPISDIAVMTVPANAPAATGVVTFTVFGPDNPTCSGAPVFTSSNRPLTGGPPTSTATSAPFTPASPGTYRWVASYSGDVNYAALNSACNDPNESSVVNQVHPTLVTQTSAPTTPGQPVSDTASLSGGFNPTGTITFTLFGPNDPTCSGPPIFTSTVPVSGNGAYNSGPFIVTMSGSYQWVAVYSGDVNNQPALSPCGAPNESFTISPAQPTLVTQATPSAMQGEPATDTATLSGGFNPTGTITFTAYGPNDATCVGPPAFTSTEPVNGNGSYTSDPFTIPVNFGTYRWIAVYSGDVNNLPVSNACNDPNEMTMVTHVDPPPTALTTQATSTATVGTPVSDTATLSGGFNPTGTITFTVYGPADPTCAGSPVFTSVVPVSGAGNYNSGPFVPSAPGTYRWVATYSGDANSSPAATACNDPNETTTVNQAVPALATSATASAVLGQPITDVATLSGGFNPTGTMTFRVYGPNDPACTGPSAVSFVPVAGNGDYSPGPFTPFRRGTYNWVVSYSGDANNLAANSPCGASGETSVVSARPTGIAVFRPSTGTWFFQNGPTVGWGTSGDIAVPADYDGNGTNQDVAVFRPSNGVWLVQGGPTVAWGTNGDIPVPADYDGNGVDDIAVFRPSNGVWYVRNGATRAWGTNGDIPVPGDYDGNGVDDMAVFRPSTGTWFIRNEAAVAFGTTGDIPVPGDYDGNGTTDIAVYRPSSGIWFIRNGPTVVWGTAGDIPVPGDYDGNGTTDIAVYRPSSGVWLVRGGLTTQWGTAGDHPIPLPAAIRAAFFTAAAT